MLFVGICGSVPTTKQSRLVSKVIDRLVAVAQAKVIKRDLDLPKKNKKLERNERDGIICINEYKRLTPFAVFALEQTLLN